jgi:hypothetical protein
VDESQVPSAGNPTDPASSPDSGPLCPQETCTCAGACPKCGCTHDKGTIQIGIEVTACPACQDQLRVALEEALRTAQVRGFRFGV